MTYEKCSYVVHKDNVEYRPVWVYVRPYDDSDQFMYSCSTCSLRVLPGLERTNKNTILVRKLKTRYHRIIYPKNSAEIDIAVEVWFLVIYRLNHKNTPVNKI